jgi:beta-lactam-binding protein with PASTA domain
MACMPLPAKRLARRHCATVGCVLGRVLVRAVAAALAVLLLTGQSAVAPARPPASEAEAARPPPLRLAPRAPLELVRPAEPARIGPARAIARLPPLIGLSLPDATARLSEAGIPYETRALDRLGGARRVMRMAPGADTPYPVGQAPTVTLYHAAAPPPRDDVAPAAIRMPDLTGLTCDEARRQLRAASRRLPALASCEEEGLTGRVPAGRIHRQDPPANAPVGPNTVLRAWTEAVGVVVPDVTGLPEDQAVERLRRSRLAAQVSGPLAREGRQVARQVPEAGSRLRPGERVQLTVDLTVPALAGLDCGAAGDRAQAHGFDRFTCELRRAGPSQPLRRVFAQAPAAGMRVDRPVALRATAAEPVRVPAVVDLGLPQAMALLRDATLIGQPDGIEGDRDVVRQQPAPDAEVAPGSTVRLSTQSFATVPEVLQMTPPQARALLERAGWTVSVDSGDREAERRVVTQQPPPGTRLALGRTVALTTQPPLTVPDVLDAPLPLALDRLADAGLSARVDRDEHAGERVVRAQRPAAGTPAAPGADVLLTTVRRVTVPALTRLSCDEARRRLHAAGLAPGPCDVDTAWPVVLGTATVDWQSHAAGQQLDEATAVAMRAAPPPWSAPAVLGSVLLVAGGAFVWLRRARHHPPPAEPAPPPVWRVVPDPAPACHLRLADGDGDGGSPDAAGRPRPARLHWRVVHRPAGACVRGLSDFTGDADDEHRD